jgi:hypothetical protein
MKGFIFKTVVMLFSSLLWLSLAAASSVDEHIKNLKSEDPEIRAKAAYELGCG